MKPRYELSWELSVALSAIGVNLGAGRITCGVVGWFCEVQCICSAFPATIEPTKYSSSDIPGPSGKEKKTQKTSSP